MGAIKGSSFLELELAILHEVIAIPSNHFGMYIHTTVFHQPKGKNVMS